MAGDQRAEDETPTDEEPDAQSASDDEHERDHAEEATDPSGDIASGGGEQPA